MAWPCDPFGTLSADVAATAALSPLAEIEAQVQARAKDLNLDLGTVPDRAVLGQLVERAIADWEAEHKRGLRPFSLADPALVADRVLRKLSGYGPLEPLLRSNPHRHSAAAQRRHPAAHRRPALAHRASQRHGEGAALPTCVVGDVEGDDS